MMLVTFPLQQTLHERSAVLGLCVYILSFLF